MASSVCPKDQWDVYLSIGKQGVSGKENTGKKEGKAFARTDLRGKEKG